MTKLLKTQYSAINFVPPESVAKQAALGLVLRREFKRGGTMVGVARARDLKNRRRISPATIKRMVAFFARHAVDKRAPGFGDVLNPSPGYVAWLLWGGDPGQEWANQILRAMQKTSVK